MPIYENRRNAENLISLSAESDSQIIEGTSAVLAQIAQCLKRLVASGHATPKIAFDGWYGVDWTRILEGLQECCRAEQLGVATLSTAALYAAPEVIAERKRQYLTEDPCFGRVNQSGTLREFIESEPLEAFRQRVSSAASPLIVYGPGAARELRGQYDLCFYFDKTADPMLWQMWNGELTPFGTDAPRKDYGWKEYYYCDFYVLQKQKQDCFEGLNYYIQAIDAAQLLMMPGAVFAEILDRLTLQPVKQIKTYSPGPWGAYRYRSLWEIPGLENNAWNRLAGADLAMLVKTGSHSFVMPSANILKDYAERFNGRWATENCPGLIPVEIWLDDGWFPAPQPAERTSMPIHNHPGTGYVQRHFNEPLGRYETYYIVEAYEGANTWMGFRNDADLEAWEEACRQSWKNQTPIPNWKEFIANWKTNVGDLFLIPEGTTHCHGGNQMVLEMDTCGNAAGGEYSFFGYDFMRPTWDDRKKSMTGRPMKMHLERYFQIDKGCRADWVRDHLRARPVVLKWTSDYSVDRYTTLPQMPFEIERIHFTTHADFSTEGKFLLAMTLTVGTKVEIRSKAHPERCATIEKFQCALVPAAFGAFEIFNEQGGEDTVVLWHLKQG